MSHGADEAINPIEWGESNWPVVCFLQNPLIRLQSFGIALGGNKTDLGGLRSVGYSPV